MFDSAAARTGAVISGRNTYDHSAGWGGRGLHPHAPLFVLSTARRPHWPKDRRLLRPESLMRWHLRRRQRVIATWPSWARAKLLDEVIVHQVPVLLGDGVQLFPPTHALARLQRVGVVVAPEGVTHLHFEVRK